MKDTTELEKTKEELRSYINQYVEMKKSEDVDPGEDIKTFYIMKAIELLGLDWFMTTLNSKIYEKYKDRELLAEMMAVANLICYETILKNCHD